ncbi:CALCRL.2 family protein [Megaselia abdita]
MSATTDTPTHITSDINPVDEITRQAREDCYATLNSSTKNTIEGLYCRGLFDNWLCWPDTKAGETALERCPGFIYGFDPTRFAHKECLPNGQWFQHPDTQKIWSNYTTCVNVEDYEFRINIRIFYELGYAISLVAILLSLMILGYFRSLKCARITLHMNLFVSFAINNTLWLVWYRTVLRSDKTIEANGVGCRVLHTVLHYFLLTNYSWMLCEGFYLHTVLVHAFIAESKLVKWLMGLGWSVPVVITLIYGLSRGLAGKGPEITHCWMEENRFSNIFVVPVCISMLMNLVFLCNIVRVLLLKLKAPASLQGNNRPSRTIVQAFKATFLLLPLLGLQYMLTPFKPDPGVSWEYTYEVISAITASFQGLFVACLFCFFNGEVIAQVKRKWRSLLYSNRPRSNSYTATQVSFVRCGPPLPGEDKV